MFNVSPASTAMSWLSKAFTSLTSTLVMIPKAATFATDKNTSANTATRETQFFVDVMVFVLNLVKLTTTRAFINFAVTTKLPSLNSYNS
ncbi:MAG: hypothetical protein Q7S27_05670 [Nanoarchaeota archaeon]|nr:hypothetical protein [Nanoarchaeota archaeon]